MSGKIALPDREALSALSVFVANFQGNSKALLVKMKSFRLALLGFDPWGAWVHDLDLELTSGAMLKQLGKIEWFKEVGEGV